MDVDFTPLFACVVSNGDYSFEALCKTKDCVIAIPGADLIKKVIDVGNCSGAATDKFKTFGLTAMPAANVKAPLIAECLANIECRVIDTKLASKYNLLILEGLQAWVEPKWKDRRTSHANGDGTFVVDGRTVNLRKRIMKWQAII